MPKNLGGSFGSDVGVACSREQNVTKPSCLASGLQAPPAYDLSRDFTQNNELQLIYYVGKPNTGLSLIKSECPWYKNVAQVEMMAR
jgi:hypothetical protein